MNMKHRARLAAACVALLSLALLAACGVDGPDPAETPTETPVETEPVTEPASESDTDAATEAATDGETETPAETEPVTATPRYDYFEAEVAPDVTIDRTLYADMKLTLPASLQITDADVTDYIEYIRFQYRTADNGTTQVKDQPLKLGDDAFIYYKGVMDGEEFEGGSNWDDESPYQLGLGSSTFIPGFESGLVGVIPANATKETPAEVHVTFPADYGNGLAGKDAIFYVAVEYAVQYTLPTYDRAFVETTLQYEAEKEFYASDKAYLSEFEGYVRTYLESQMETDIENAKIDALWNYLIELVVCQNLPQLELDFYYNNYVAEIEYYYEYYTSYGGSAFTEEYPTLDDFAKAYTAVGKDGDWKAELQAVAHDMVSRDMLAHAIAEWEGIETVTDEEYAAELAYWYDYYYGYMTEAEILQSMGELALRESAFAAKMQDWLLARTTFTFEAAA